jgi:ABC-type sugar transport system substrate-binding protein
MALGRSPICQEKKATMSQQHDADEQRPRRGMTRASLLRRAATSGAVLAAPAATIATFNSGSSQPAYAGGTVGSFPGGTDYDAAVKKIVNGRTLKVGLTMPALAEFWTQIEHAAWWQMKTYQDRFGVGWRWRHAAPQGTYNAVDEQINIIENWVTLGYDAVFVATIGDFAAMQRVYERAESKGTSIFQMNMPMELWPIEEVKDVSNISYDNAMQGGYVAGKYIAEKLGGNGKVLVLWGPAGNNWTTSRSKGFELALKEHPGLKVVGTGDGGYVRDKGFNTAQNLLQSHPDANAIFGENEEMALGASQAIDARGLKHWDGKEGILTLGMDGLRSGFAAIRKGTLTATIDVGGIDIGLQGIQTLFASKVLGMSVDRVVNVPTVVVDKSNVDLRDAYYAWALAGPKY